MPLKSRSLFSHVVRHGRRIRESSGMLRLYALLSAERSGRLAVGVIIPRSVCPHAVGRNRLRRLLRESIRLVCRQRPQLVEPYAVLIVRWIGTPKLPCKQLYLQQVYPLLQTALEYAQKTEPPVGTV
ncbi:MAG: ribonuclease P protein component [Chlorobi bacterium]|nr:ribonuclease P protein component [Chlorobiota bacterium]